ncbi:MAG: alanyl-tRNA editing protein [Proteobacteria bacterium]|jgi:misacylated tRNA(Ala) deacylase|nr:alanyl-tRNA editing protein [Pseudomonadota bacterium]
MTEELFRDDAYLTSCVATVLTADDTGVVFDRTVFYPTAGGQPGDCGEIRLKDGRVLSISDTQKGNEGQVLHVLTDPSDLPAVGAQADLVIDWLRRHRLMRMHTCMHLLCAVIAGGVTGGSIRDGSARLDFDLPDTLLDKEQITKDLNALIAANHPVSSRWVNEAELDEHPELVRTMSVTPPRGQGTIRLLDIEGIDLQPCGGTHVKSTGEIGAVKVKKIEKKGKHNRRVNIVFDDA